MSLKTSDGQLVIVSGSSRCGKTAKTLRLVSAFGVVFVWDIEAQWCKQKGYKKVNSLVDLKKIVISGKAGKYAYVSGGNIKAEFELFSACVFHYGSYFGACAVVAEELADVTTTAKAGENWGILCRRGLKRGISIFAISQRWAEADKTAMGNASDFYLFRMASGSDIAYMSKKTRVPVAQLEKLQPLEYVHYNALTGEVKPERLTF